MPPHGFGGPDFDRWKDAKPKNIKEVPGYLRRVISGTFRRIGYVFGIVWNTRHWILFVMIFMALYNGLMPVVASLISANLLNSLVVAITSKELDKFYLFLILQFSYLIFNSLIHNVYNIISRFANEYVTNNIKIKIINKAKEVDLASFDNPEFYERLENANREAGNRPIQILNNTFGIISTLISTVIYIVVMVKIIPLAPLVIILVSVPSAIVSFIYRRKTFNYIRRRSIDRREMSYYSDLMVNKDLVKEIRLFGLSDRFITGYKNVFARYFKGLKKLITHEGLWNIGIMLVSTVVNCILYIKIGQSVIYGDGQVGDFSFYTGALNSIASSVASLISTTATIYEGTLFIDNLILFMNEKKTIVPVLGDGSSGIAEPLKVTRHIPHEIEFSHVSFSYPGTERKVLNDISFVLKPGETCVLVGLNGAGKTTLIKLLTRLYDPTEGTIFLDGKDIKNYDVEDLYRVFGIIFQDFGKYAFSVRDNIAFGDIEKEVDDGNIYESAHQADAESFIDKLPKGIDTPLMRIFHEDGIELSIGQWQKLSIARAFYSDSDILILDEPTASLDAIAEQEIFSEFDRLRADKTTIFVSHRLSSATIASKIIVLDGGIIAEEGTHEELMRRKGKYYELFSTQARRYVESAEKGLMDGAPNEVQFTDRQPGGRHERP